MSAIAGNPKRVLVTGGAGFIGSHLVERLLNDGRSVVVIDDLSTGSLENLRTVRDHSRFRFIQARVSDCKELTELTANAESIFHLAAAVGVELVLRSPIQTIRTNLDDTAVILDAASRHRVPVLLASSSEVYGKSTKEVFSEDDDLLIGPPHLARWGYACSKLMDEFLALAHAREHGLPVVIARIFNTIGPRQSGRHGMVLPRFIAAARAGEPLRVFGDGAQTRCFCYVADTVEALVRLERSASARGRVFNVGSTQEVSIAELARLVVATLRSPSAIGFVPYERAYQAGFEDLVRRQPSIRRLEEATGFTPSTPLQEIIMRTAAAC